jgi:hypothetical protein
MSPWHSFSCATADAERPKRGNRAARRKRSFLLSMRVSCARRRLRHAVRQPQRHGDQERAGGKRGRLLQQLQDDHWMQHLELLLLRPGLRRGRRPRHLRAQEPGQRVLPAVRAPLPPDLAPLPDLALCARKAELLWICLRARAHAFYLRCAAPCCLIWHLRRSSRPCCPDLVPCARRAELLKGKAECAGHAHRFAPCKPELVRKPLCWSWRLLQSRDNVKEG